MPSARGPFLVACQQKAQQLKYCYIPNRLKNKPNTNWAQSALVIKIERSAVLVHTGIIVVSRPLEHQNHDVGDEAGSLQATRTW